MANKIFVDTAGWANFFIKKQPQHQACKQLVQQYRLHQTQFVTTNYIILELVALLHSPLRIPPAVAVPIVETIKQVEWIEIIHITAALDNEAWQLRQARLDKNWSLVDCSSFVIMQKNDIREALTTDAHFEQAGFSKVLK